MRPPHFPSDTGLGPLEDTGELTYNGITFSCLYTTKLSGKVIPDDANRTKKFVHYSLYVEGLVTSDGRATSDNLWTDLRVALSQPGGNLRYDQGYGFFHIDPPGGTVIGDASWGPFPTLLEFSPLGGQASAFIRWQVDVKIPEYQNSLFLQESGFMPVLQFNWEYHLKYDENHYAQYRINGVLEVPLTRSTVEERRVTRTVDDFRQKWLDMTVDLTRFRVTERTFDYSRDKRTVNWLYAVEELPPMGVPPGCSTARGMFSVKNSNPLISNQGVSKIAFTSWTCSLRCTYSVRADQDRRVAFLAFYSLLWFRLQQSRFGVIPGLNDPDPAAQNDDRGAVVAAGLRAGNRAANPPPAANGDNAVDLWNTLFNLAQPPNANLPAKGTILTDFGVDEGLYLDSDKITLHATWMLTTNWTCLLAATGFCQWQAGTAGRGDDNFWAQSILLITGWRSMVEGRLNADTDLIVDFGGGGPWGQPN